MERKKKLGFILGILILCTGMQLANYGTAVCVSSAVAQLDGSDYYVLINAMGTLGMILVLPVAGRFTAMLGMRKMILTGIVVQLAGRCVMIAAESWIPFAAGYLLQSVGGGCYISSTFVLMTQAVPSEQRSRYFSYISVANALGAILGPILASNVFAVGGMTGKLAYIIYLPLTVIGYAMVYRRCPADQAPGAADGFDYVGLLLSVIGMSCLILWLNLGGKVFVWISIPSFLMAAAAVTAIWLLVKRELRIPAPAVPIRMFRNRRLTAAIIAAMAASAYSACSAAYSVMWIRLNYMAYPGATQLVGTASLPQHLVILILGFFIGGYVGRSFQKRFRIFGIASMAAAMLATGILFCLQFTGTATDGNVMTLHTLPAGMLMIWIAVAIGGFTSVVSQSTFSAFWQSNTPEEELSAGQALYTIGSTGGSCLFGAVVGVVLGTSGDYSRAFAVGFVFALIGFVTAIREFRFDR